ncbi:MAG: glycosyltransferase, partial [Spongiibacteraceae bacterium]|nr:glycosyltransferase [Spongiibacteraceae bacterium]
MEWLFWLLLVGLVYSYFLYPILLKLVLAVRPRSGPGIAPEQPLPSMTLVVTVHNESQRIRDKLANSLEIDYPAELLEVIVASDCSTDDTDDIVANYAPGRVRLVRADQRKGKEYAQLCAIREAQGEIIVFSD